MKSDGSTTTVSSRGTAPACNYRVGHTKLPYTENGDSALQSLPPPLTVV